MDTAAYLTRHGWQGTGHPLHPGSRGIKKPLLVSRRSNLFGVGKKKHDAHADQWWARAFNDSLKGFEVGEPGDFGMTSRATASHQGSVDPLSIREGKWGGLYDAFVKGEGLEGTVSREEPDSELEAGARVPKDRKLQEVSTIKSQLKGDQDILYADLMHSLDRNLEESKGEAKEGLGKKKKKKKKKDRSSRRVPESHA